MNRDYEKRVGEKIHRLRAAKGMTQEQFAAKLQTLGCDITRSALAKIEVGQRHIYPDEIKAIAEVLDVGYGEIFD